MTSTFKLAGAGLLAAILTAAMFLSPVGLASAQDPLEDETTAPADTEDETDRSERGDREELTDEEREAKQAERQASQEETLSLFADELGVTVADVESAGLAVLDARLAERVTDGDLTQDEADTIRERAEEAGGLSFGQSRGHGGRGR